MEELGTCSSDRLAKGGNRGSTRKPRTMKMVAWTSTRRSRPTAAGYRTGPGFQVVGLDTGGRRPPTSSSAPVKAAAGHPRLKRAPARGARGGHPVRASSGMGAIEYAAGPAYLVRQGPSSATSRSWLDDRDVRLLARARGRGRATTRLGNDPRSGVAPVPRCAGRAYRAASGLDGPGTVIRQPGHAADDEIARCCRRC